MINKKKSFLSLFFYISFCLFIKNVQAVETAPIKVYRAMYALESSRIKAPDQNGSLTKEVITGYLRQKQNSALMLTKDVLILTDKTANVSVNSQKNKTFVVAREASFLGMNEEVSKKSMPLYLLDRDWEPCQAKSQNHIILVPNSEGNKKQKDGWNGIVLKGCATHPNRYASFAVQGNDINEILWIDEQNTREQFLKDQQTRYYRAPDYYKGMSDSIRLTDQHLQKRYQQEDLAEFNRKEKEKIRQAEKAIEEMNGLLKYSEVKVTPIGQRKKSIYIKDPQVQAFVDAAAKDESFKEFKPIIFIISQHQPSVLFVHPNNNTFKLTTLKGSHLQVIQTENDSL